MIPGIICGMSLQMGLEYCSAPFMATWETSQVYDKSSIFWGGGVGGGRALGYSLPLP